MNLNLFDLDNFTTAQSGGIFKVVEQERDMSIHNPSESFVRFYMEQTKLKRRQLCANLDGKRGLITSSGLMQMTVGKLKVATDVKGVGDMVSKLVKGKSTGESAIKPRYTGKGVFLGEPTYKHIILLEIFQHEEPLVINDGMFLACEDTVELKIAMPTSLSGALLGGEGLFNLKLAGSGWVAIESNTPVEELITITIEDGEELKIDGSFAVMWDNSLTLTVERSSRTLIGSSVTGEGLVNVYRGQGTVWVDAYARETQFNIPSRK